MKKLIFIISVFYFSFYSFGIDNVQAQVYQNTQNIFSDSIKKNEIRGYLNDYVLDALYDKKDKKGNIIIKKTYGENRMRATAFILTKFFYNIFIPISILLTVFAGVQLIFSRGKEEIFNEKKTQFIGIFLGFAVILLSKVFIDDVFFGIYQVPSGGVDVGWWDRMTNFYFDVSPSNEIIDAGQILSNSDSTEFAKAGFRQMEGIFNYIITFVVGISVLFVIYASFKMITADSDDTMSKAKKQIFYVLGGMAVLVSGRKIIALFRDEKASKLGLDGLYNNGNLSVPEVSSTIDFVIQWTNYALNFIGIVSIVALVYGGIQLIGSMGENDEAQATAKKIVISAITGIVLSISAWTIIQYFIAV